MRVSRTDPRGARGEIPRSTRLCEEVTTIYEFIKNNANAHSVKLMRKLLKVSRSSFYKFLNKKESKRYLENKELKSKIIKVYEDSKKRYGAPKIHKTLKAENIHISLKRVQRLMKRLDIKAVVCKKFRPFPAKVKVEDRENILKRDFLTTSINGKWATD